MMVAVGSPLTGVRSTREAEAERKVRCGLCCPALLPRRPRDRPCSPFPSFLDVALKFLNSRSFSFLGQMHIIRLRYAQGDKGNGES